MCILCFYYSSIYILSKRKTKIYNLILCIRRYIYLEFDYEKHRCSLDQIYIYMCYTLPAGWFRLQGLSFLYYSCPFLSILCPWLKTTDLHLKYHPVERWMYREIHHIIERCSLYFHLGMWQSTHALEKVNGS